DPDHEQAEGEGKLTWAWVDNDTKVVTVIDDYDSMGDWISAGERRFTHGPRSTAGGALSEHFVGDATHNRNWFYERLQFLYYLKADAGMILYLDENHTRGNVTISITLGSENSHLNGAVSWDPSDLTIFDQSGNHWNNIGSNLVSLVHELTHARGFFDPENEEFREEITAVYAENSTRYRLFTTVPGFGNLWPRAGISNNNGDVGLTWYNRLWWGPDNAWEEYWGKPHKYPINN
ncbi:MAG: hypothetical protein GTO24_27105, partial [candidate division Zixibacteria bacterium]|nr:hypothetical protein [candidate division Zixibacteria bacterium]